jgi:hypothetical protein
LSGYEIVERAEIAAIEGRVGHGYQFPLPGREAQWSELSLIGCLVDSAVAD